MASLSSEPLPTLVLLRKLAQSGFLVGGLSNVQGGRWRQSLISALADLLSEGDVLDLDRRRILGQVLKLIPSLGDEEFMPQVSTLIKSLVEEGEKSGSETLQEDFKTRVWNDTHLLSVLLRSAENMLKRGSEIGEKVIKGDLAGDLEAMLSLWYWNREVMGSIASLSSSWQVSLR